MSFIPNSSDASDKDPLPDFSHAARTTALAYIQNGEASREERLKATEYLRRYAATLSSIFDEYTLSNDYHKGMVALDESITSVLNDAGKTLPELKELKAQPEKHPTVKITFEERESLLNAITEERKKRYEESKKSRGYK